MLTHWLTEHNGGSDGARTFTYDFAAIKAHEQQEIVDPLLLASDSIRQRRFSVPRTRTGEDQWKEVAQRHAGGESLRRLAKGYGIPHEAVRQTLKR
jgi:hypothetical protein